MKTIYKLFITLVFLQIVGFVNHAFGQGKREVEGHPGIILRNLSYLAQEYSKGDVNLVHLENATGVDFSNAYTNEVIAAVPRLDSVGYTVYDLGMFVNSSYTIDKGEKIKQSAVDDLDAQHEKFFLSIYILDNTGAIIDYEVKIKYGTGGVEDSISDYDKIFIQELMGNRMRNHQLDMNGDVMFNLDSEAKGINGYADYLIQIANGNLGNHFKETEYYEFENKIKNSEPTTYVSPAGIPITLPASSVVKFMMNPDPPAPSGCLIDFKLPNGKWYTGRYNKLDSTQFEGYIHDAPEGEENEKWENPEPFPYQVGETISVVLGYKNLFPCNIEVQNCPPNGDPCVWIVTEQTTYVVSEMNSNGDGIILSTIEHETNYEEGNMRVDFVHCPLPVAFVDYENGHKVFNPFGKHGILVKTQNVAGQAEFIYIAANYDDLPGNRYYRWDEESYSWIEEEEIVEPVYSFLAYMYSNGFLHFIYDVGGAVPIIGVVFDLLNTHLYILEGDLENAALTAITVGVGFADEIFQALKYVDDLIGIVKMTKNGVGNLDPRFFDMKNLNDYVNTKNWDELEYSKFAEDMASNDDLFEAFCQNPKLADAWDVLRRAGRNNLKKDINVLQKVSEILEKPGIDDFVSNIRPIDSQIPSFGSPTDFLEKFSFIHTDVPGGQLPLIEELENLSYFIDEFNDIENVGVYLDEMVKSGEHFKGSSYGIELLKNNFDELSENGNYTIAAFESNILPGGNHRLDFKFIDVNNPTIEKLIETKNWATPYSMTLPKNYSQFKAYVSSDIKFEYWFKGNATQMKNKFQTLFTYDTKVTELWIENSNFFTSKGYNSIQQIVNDATNGYLVSNNSPLLGFIKE